MTSYDNVSAEDYAQFYTTMRAEQAAAPPISGRRHLSADPSSCQLANELFGSDGMLQKIRNGILPRYGAIRYLRRDGSCFYRASLFRLLEQCVEDSSLLEHVTRAVAVLRPQMLSMFQYADDFCDVVEETLGAIQNGRIRNGTDLMDDVCDAGRTEYLVFFFRYAVSCFLRAHCAEYEDFVLAMGFSGMDAYCAAEVEVVGSEADHMHMTAFAGAFAVRFVVEYLDNSPGDVTNAHVVEPPTPLTPQSTVHLLYRPGHYDLLYPLQS